MNSKNHNQRRKWRFQRSGLIFYCYLLIPLNELAINTLNINALKIRKKIIDISMISVQNAQNAVFSQQSSVNSNEK
jgi:hypothetical protein